MAASTSWRLELLRHASQASVYSSAPPAAAPTLGGWAAVRPRPPLRSLPGGPRSMEPATSSRLGSISPSASLRVAMAWRSSASGQADASKPLRNRVSTSARAPGVVALARRTSKTHTSKMRGPGAASSPSLSSSLPSPSPPPPRFFLPAGSTAALMRARKAAATRGCTRRPMRSASTRRASTTAAAEAGPLALRSGAVAWGSRPGRQWRRARSLAATSSAMSGVLALSMRKRTTAGMSATAMASSLAVTWSMARACRSGCSSTRLGRTCK